MEKSIKLKKIKNARKHGFFKRTSTRIHRKVLKRRILRKRKRLT